MKLKITATNLIFFLSCFAIILEMNFFYLVDMPDAIAKLNTLYTKSLVGFLACFIVIVMVMLRCKIENSLFLKNYNYFIFCISIVMFIITLILYPLQKIETTIRLCSNWLVCWMTYPLTYLVQKDKAVSLYKFLNLIAFIWYIVAIAQFFMFKNYGSMILNNYDEVTRNGVIRISILSVGELMLIYNFYELTKDKSKLKFKILNIIQLVLGLYTLIVVQASRGNSIIMIITLAVIYLVNSKKDYKLYLRASVLVGILIYLINSSVLSDLIDSFSISGQYGISTVNRIYAIKYFWSCFVKSPLWGIAYPGDEIYGNILHGISGTSYVSDVGIVGLMGQTGIWALIIYFIFLGRMVYVLKRNFKKNARLDPLGTGLLVYSCISIVTENLLVPACIMKFALVITYFEYLNFSSMCKGMCHNKKYAIYER